MRAGSNRHYKKNFIIKRRHQSNLQKKKATQLKLWGNLTDISAGHRNTLNRLTVFTGSGVILMSSVREGAKMYIQKVPMALSLVPVFAVVGLGISARDLSFPTPAYAQAIPKSLEAGGSESELRLRKNQWTVGVAGGLLSGSYMMFADEMAQVLDDGDNLRIVPIVTYGAASNLDDLL